MPASTLTRTAYNADTYDEHELRSNGFVKRLQSAAIVAYELRVGVNEIVVSFICGNPTQVKVNDVWLDESPESFEHMMKLVRSKMYCA